MKKPVVTSAAALAVLAGHSQVSASTSGQEFKGLDDWIEVFQAGDHVDSKGRDASFSEADLDQMVLNLKHAPAPAVLGHPKHNDPAYAWLREGGLKRDGKHLFAKFEDINPDFKAGVDSGAYRNRSLSVVKDEKLGWRVRHVGWLGAAPPAIEGLKPLDYSAADDANVLEFSAETQAEKNRQTGWALTDLAELLRGQREQLIADKGLEAADAALPNWRIQGVLALAEQIKQDTQAGASAAVLFSHTNPNDDKGGSMTTITAEQLAAAEEKARKEAREAAQAEFNAQGEELRKLRSERQAERIGAQIKDWKSKGLVTPAEEPGLAEFMAALDAQEAQFNFSAPEKGQDGKPVEVKKTITEFFAEFMSKRAPVVRLGQAAVTTGSEGAAVDMDDQHAIARAASEFQAAEAKAGRTIAIDEAVAHVVRGGK